MHAYRVSDGVYAESRVASRAVRRGHLYAGFDSKPERGAYGVFPGLYPHGHGRQIPGRENVLQRTSSDDYRSVDHAYYRAFGRRYVGGRLHAAVQIFLAASIVAVLAFLPLYFVRKDSDRLRLTLSEKRENAAAKTAQTEESAEITEE